MLFLVILGKETFQAHTWHQERSAQPQMAVLSFPGTHGTPGAEL